MAKNYPKGSKSNPFFRDRESNFSEAGGIRSVVGSSFNCPTRSGNAMEDELSRVSRASRGATFGGKKGGK